MDNFPEPFDFADPKRDYTRRYEEFIFHQVRHTTVCYVAQREDLTDKVVARIFLRQVHKHLPAAPFEGVTRLGIDEIGDYSSKEA